MSEPTKVLHSNAHDRYLAEIQKERRIVYITVLGDEPLGRVNKSLKAAKASLEGAKKYNTLLKDAKIFECKEVV